MKTRTTLGLYVTEKRDHGYFHVNASVVTIGTRAEERAAIDAGRTDDFRSVNSDTIRNVSNDYGRSDDTNGLYLEHLKVTSQGNDSDTDRRLYGWELSYRDVYSIDAALAARMAKTLTTIQKRMDKRDEQYGRPATFGAYLARVAQAIGASAIVTESARNGSSSYRDMSHRIQTIGDGIYRVDHIIQTWTTERHAA